MSALPHPDAPPATLDELLYALRITLRQLSAETGIATRVMRRWRAGTVGPSPRHREALDAWLRARGSSLDELSLIPEAPMATLTVLSTRRPAASPTDPVTPEEPMDIATLELLHPAALEYFNLPSDPFDTPENPEDIYLSPAIRRVEAMLLAGIKRRQIVAVVGDPGAGKSTIVRRLYGRVVGEKQIRMVAPASLDRRKITSSAIAVAIIRDLTGRETSSWSMEQRSELLRTTLEDMGRNSITPVLLIDEAHHLSPAALIALKQVWDSHTLWKQLAVILVGQLPLRDALRTRPDLREVAGRTLLVELPSLVDAGDYLRWRFSRVGGAADKAFDASAYKALAIRAEYPLWVNNLAVRAMLYAHSVGDTQVTAAHIGRS